jgi:hypothetical protein
MFHLRALDNASRSPTAVVRGDASACGRDRFEGKSAPGDERRWISARNGGLGNLLVSTNACCWWMQSDVPVAKRYSDWTMQRRLGEAVFHPGTATSQS